MFNEFADAESLAAHLAVRVANALREDVERNGRASLVVSGGSTPRPLFRQLRAADLPWERVTVTLADERWVPATAPESNERQVRDELLTERAAAARFTGLKTAHTTPEEGRAESARNVRAVPRPFSVVVLGMGTDGHTASLFPYMDGLDAALRVSGSCPVQAARPAGAGGTAALPRLTMTLSALADARLVILHITGEDKRQVYQRALEGEDVRKMPVRAILRLSGAPVEIWWAP